MRWRSSRCVEHVGRTGFRHADVRRSNLGRDTVGCSERRRHRDPWLQAQHFTYSGQPEVLVEDLRACPGYSSFSLFAQAIVAEDDSDVVSVVAYGHALDVPFEADQLADVDVTLAPNEGSAIEMTIVGGQDTRILSTSLAARAGHGLVAYLNELPEVPGTDIGAIRYPASVPGRLFWGASLQGIPCEPGHLGATSSVSIVRAQPENVSWEPNRLAVPRIDAGAELVAWSIGDDGAVGDTITTRQWVSTDAEYSWSLTQPAAQAGSRPLHFEVPEVWLADAAALEAAPLTIGHADFAAVEGYEDYLLLLSQPEADLGESEHVSGRVDCPE